MKIVKSFQTPDELFLDQPVLGKCSGVGDSQDPMHQEIFQHEELSLAGYLKERP